MKTSLLLIEDDLILGESLKDRLELEGYKVQWISNADPVLESMDSLNFDLMISDFRLPGISGAELFHALKKKHQDLPPFILITGYGTISLAVETLKAGVDDFMTKPLDIDRLLLRIHELVGERTPRDDENAFRLSPGIRHIEGMLLKLVPHPELVTLLLGESGVGKEVCAERLHQLACPDSPFEAVNCAALPADLIGSELFGHEKGAFTGAFTRHEGAFERAGDGLLFLDEIGDMNLDLQAQLLRVLESRRFNRIGGSDALPVQARIVCATNADLLARVEQGLFREDLYFRLNVVKIEIPPLRERPEDILWLMQQFMEEHAERSGRGILPEMNPQLKQAVLDYQWPGNVRELKNAIDRACIFCDGEELSSELLGLPLLSSAQPRLEQTVEQAERKRIIACLQENKFRIQQTAQALGISRKGLWQKMKRLRIDKNSFR